MPAGGVLGDGDRGRQLFTGQRWAITGNYRSVTGRSPASTRRRWFPDQGLATFGAPSVSLFDQSVMVAGPLVGGHPLIVSHLSYVGSTG